MTRFMKCAFAGVISLVVGTVVLAFGAILALHFIPAAKGRVPMPEQLITLAKSPAGLVAGFALFLFGFIGEARRN